MKILKSIFGNPIWIILLVTIIAFAIPRQFILGKSIAICSLMGISLLVLIFNRQWLRLFLGFLGYCIFLVGSIFFSMFDSMAEPNYEIGDRKFYDDEIHGATKVYVPKQLEIIAKIDTIVFMGIEGEYNAECLYSGNSSAIIKLEKQILLKKEFKKLKELDDFPTKVITKKNFNVNEFKSIYRKEEIGRYNIVLAFNKNHTRFYYKALYY